MCLNYLKTIAIAVIAIPMIAIGILRSEPVGASTFTAGDPAATYKAKCAMCHTATASKFFDAAKTEEELVQTILKGRKGEKPPFMPAFEEKGIDADAAKELVAFMKQVRSETK